MRIHCLQHEKFEEPAFINTWAKEKGFKMAFTKLFEEEYAFPSIDSFDFLVILGGSMSTYEEDKFAFLIPEKEFIVKAISSRKKILGICLGSQLLANTLGAKVYPNTEKEIGWLPIHLNEEGVRSPFFNGIASETTVFHWHGDTFDLPKDAIRLAKSEGCLNQAFSVGNKILALQFHLEIESESVNLMVKYGKEELVEGKKYIQSSETILQLSRHIPANNLIMRNILDRFLSI